MIDDKDELYDVDSLVPIPSYLSEDDDTGISLLSDDCPTMAECTQCEVASQYTCGEGCTQGCYMGCAESCSESCSQSCSQSSSGSVPGVGTSLTVSNITYNSAKISFASISGATRYTIAYRPTSTSTATEISTTSTSYTLTGLSPETTYIVNYRGVNSYGTGGYMSSGVTFTTEAEPIDVDYWSWTKSNGSATAAQTQAAYTAVTSNGETSSFSYLVWNDLVDKVMEIINATGVSWSTAYGTYANTKMSSSDRVLTATRFNALRQNIGSRVSTGISEVSTGDIVYGSYFITLASCINTWIG